ncbi:CinA family protein [Ornithinicoccus halotolerans]|uniref:CinA family protein n=1 Tax=Ornithinicoccus halotolerans TaxID=1748220 RepID=UPI001294F1AE|nr:nicotinamide-nucleotide amidohydrolase family protein [Ornithinicoccus halotolerans]
MTDPRRPVTATAAARAEQLVRALRGGGTTVATAESLTGGLVCAVLTAVPGASAAVLGGVVAYSAELKQQLLGVPASLLERHGTVAAATAEAMAEGVRARTGAGWGLATTGVAGPDPLEGHPVGTVHVAVAGEGGTVSRALTLGGDRADVRAGTVEEVLALALERLS